MAHATEIEPCRQFDNDQGAMAAYVATIFPHGGALIYGSQEVGFPEPINFFHYVPVDWTAKPDIYQEYQQLIGLYNNYPALRKGQLKTWTDKDVLLFEKSIGGGDSFLIAVDVRDAQNSIAVPADWRGAKVVNMANDKPQQLDDSLHLAPYEYLILKKDNQ